MNLIVTRTYLVEEEIKVSTNDIIEDCEMEDGELFDKNVLLIENKINSGHYSTVSRTPISSKQVIKIKRL